MADLTALSPFAGHALPLSLGKATLAEFLPGGITCLMPFRGREEAVAEALGLPLPAPGRMVAVEGAALIWSGRACYLLLGGETTAEAVAQRLDGLAAVTDQSDGWCGLMLSGDAAEAVLARLCPIDPAALPDGGTARTELAHMAVQLTRVGGGFEILALRSFADTLLHDIRTAIESVAAQAVL